MLSAGKGRCDTGSSIRDIVECQKKGVMENSPPQIYHSIVLRSRNTTRGDLLGYS